MNQKLIQLTLEESIGSKMDEYTAFVNSVMNNVKFRKCANSLLPFDGVVHADIPFPDENIAMGISIMRIDIEAEIFALGITLEVDSIQYFEKPFNATIFISAAQTFDEMCEYVKSSQFADDVKENFYKQIKDNYYGGKN